MRRAARGVLGAAALALLVAAGLAAAAWERLRDGDEGSDG